MKKSTLLIALIMFLAASSLNADVKNSIKKFKQQIEKLSESDFKLENKKYMQGQAQFEFYNLKLNYTHKKDLQWCKIDVDKIKMVNFPQKNIEDKINSVIYKKYLLDEIKNISYEFFDDLNGLTEDDVIEFNYSISYKINYNSNDLLSISEYNDRNSGGMRGDVIETDYIFDLKTGNKIGLSDIIDNSKNSQFKKLLWKKLKKEINIEPELTEKKFKISEKIIITNKNIVFSYDAYEIADYINLPIELKLSFKEIKQYLKNGSPLERIIK